MADGGEIVTEKNIQELREIFAHAAVGDFSKDVPLPDSEDPKQMEFFIGLQIMLNVIRQKITILEEEISVRKQREELVKRREEEFRALSENSPDIVALFDRQHRHVYVNKAVEKVTGIFADDFIGKTHKDLNMPESLQTFWSEKIENVFTLGQETSFEFDFQAKNGLRHFHCRLVPVFGKDRTIQNVLAVAHDITELKDLEKSYELRATELDKQTRQVSEEKARQEALILSIADGLVMVDRDGKVIFVNDNACQLLEFDREEILGKVWGKDLPQIHDKKGRRVAYEKTSTFDALTNGKSRVSTYFYTKKTNVGIPVSVNSAPVVLKGSIQGAVSVIRDVTHETELEKMKNEFVSMASHELRTPLTGIRGALSMMFDGKFGPVSDNLKDPLVDIYKAADRLQNMTDDILSISRLETGELKFVAEPIDLRDLIDSVYSETKPIFEKKNLTFSQNIPENTLVLADSMKLRQICTNVIGNALKFTDRGSISVTTSQNGPMVEILFKDTGIGIEDEDKDKLFQKFHQVSQGTSRPAGTGLGLYISKQFALKMGGDLTLAYSKLNAGSGFLLTLPTAK